MKSKREREEPCGVCGHYHDYEGGEPCGICGHRLVQTEQPKPQAPSALPTEVLPGFLFLGTYDHASRAELLKTLGIGNILNTVPSCQNLYKNSFNYLTVSATPPPLDECWSFIESVREAGGKVLVHCMSGTSRSPSVVVAYLMRLRRWRLSEAFSWVRDRRPSISITAADAARLQAAEAELLGPHASAFQIPVGGAPAGAALVQPSGGGPFSWQPAAPAAPQQQPGLQQSFQFLHSGGAAQHPSGGFVFGQQQQQQQQADMME